MRSPLRVSCLLLIIAQSFAATSCRVYGQPPASFLGADGVLTEQEVADGWIALFDGETLFGWRPQSLANWRIENGSLVVDKGEICLLCTTTQFSDYVLSVEYRADAETNSGVFLRTSPDPREVTRDCYELNIAPPDNPFPTGSLVGRGKYDGATPDQQWHHFLATVDGNHVLVELDGRQVMDYTDPDPPGRGFIGLQHNQGRVEFRNVKLKPLGAKSIFNRRDLDGWRTYPDMPGKFTVTPEGNLSVRGGPGQLESAGVYGDFVLQFECVTHGVQLNSGVFFRCIPGEQMNGYECQIQNGFVDGDRTQPVDAGTGAIFRRTKARRVVADDFDWFHATLVAEGPHMAVWVEGYPVTDWSDRRPPDNNPRRGRRIEPGTIMIQAHDPTTALSLRNLRLSEMRPRR